jgi:hypothetical protein
MVKRLGGVLLGFGVNIAGEFCISYNMRLGGVCARDLPTLTVVSLCRCVRTSPGSVEMRWVGPFNYGKGLRIHSEKILTFGTKLALSKHYMN